MNLTPKISQTKELEELKELILVFADVFEIEDFKMPSESHLQKLLAQKTFFSVIAKVNDKVIGGLTIYLLEHYYSPRPLAYLYDLAVMKAYQRKGVGKSLIAFVNNYCKQKGFEEVFVQADKVDKYAIDFYRSTKPTAEEQVVHFCYKLNSNNDNNGD